MTWLETPSMSKNSLKAVSEVITTSLGDRKRFRNQPSYFHTKLPQKTVFLTTIGILVQNFLHYLINWDARSKHKCNSCFLWFGQNINTVLCMLHFRNLIRVVLHLLYSYVLSDVDIPLFKRIIYPWSISLNVLHSCTRNVQYHRTYPLTELQVA